MVGGIKHHDGDRDCSKPCMFLDGMTCRLDGSDARCVEEEEPQVEMEQLPPVKKWTDDEIALLSSGKTASEIAEMTGRSVPAVRSRMSRIRSDERESRGWNSREIELIYIWRNDRKVAELTGRTVKACKVKRQKLRVPHEEVNDG